MVPPIDALNVILGVHWRGHGILGTTAGHHAADTHLITKRYYYYENEYRTKVHKNKNTHTMNVLGLIGTHKLYHKINVFTVKTL